MDMGRDWVLGSCDGRPQLEDSKSTTPALSIRFRPNLEDFVSNRSGLPSHEASYA
jgi:hypothetical protein